MLFLTSGKLLPFPSLEDLAADYDIAYRRSGYESAGSSAHGSLTSLGMYRYVLMMFIYLHMHGLIKI